MTVRILQNFRSIDLNQKTIKIIMGVKDQDAILTLACTDARRIVAALEVCESKRFPFI